MSDKLPSYRQHKATGQAVVTLNGKDFYLGVFSSDDSRAAYDRVIAEWLAHGRQLPRTATTTGITVVELCAAYLRFAEVHYSRDGKPTSEYVAMRDVVKATRDREITGGIEKSFCGDSRVIVGEQLTKVGAIRNADPLVPVKYTIRHRGLNGPQVRAEGRHLFWLPM